MMYIYIPVYCLPSVVNCSRQAEHLFQTLF
jgi:hypothetical protein